MREEVAGTWALGPKRLVMLSQRGIVATALSRMTGDWTMRKSRPS